MKILRPLDFQELFRLVQKNENASSKVKGQDIILFLGGTGSGKSTTILYLSGNTMQKIVVNGMNHIEALNSKNPDIITKPDAKSVTRYISTVKVNLSDFDMLVDQESITLCDTTGFEDTNGAEVDFANALGIINTIKEAKSVRPVGVFSYKSQGDRFQGVKKIAHILVGMINDLKSHMGSLSYIFTKYPEDERDKISANIKNFFQNMQAEERRDENFNTFIKDMYNKARQKTIIIDPLKENQGDILETLLDRDPIEYPSEVFSFSVSAESLHTATEQLQKHKDSIQIALMRENFELVDYRCNQIKMFYDLIKLDFIQKVFIEIKTMVQAFFNQKYKEAISSIDLCFKNENTLTYEDLNKFMLTMKTVQVAGFFRLKDKIGDLVGEESYLAYLKSTAEQLSDNLKNFIPIKDREYQVILNKLKLLSTYDNFLQELYELEKEEINKLILKQEEEMNNSFMNDEFEKSFETLIYLKNIKANLRDHLISTNDLKQKIKSFINVVFERFTNESTQIITNILNKGRFQTPITQQEIETCNQFLEKLANVRAAYYIRPFQRTENFTQTQTQFEAQIIMLVELISNRIQENLKDKSGNLFNEMHINFVQMKLIRSIEGIMQQTLEHHHNSVSKVIQFLHEKKRDIENSLQNFDIIKGFDFEILLKDLKLIKQASWIDEFQPGICENIIEVAQERIVAQITKIQNIILRMSLDFEHPQEIRTCSELLEILPKFSNFSDVSDIFDKKIKQISTGVWKIMNEQMQIIVDLCDIDKYEKQRGFGIPDFNKLSQCYLYLDTCIDARINQFIEPFQDANFQSVKNNLEVFIKNHFYAQN